MNRRETRLDVVLPGRSYPTHWLLAVLLFGVGDVVTTSIGLGLPGVMEADPVARTMIDSFGIGAILGLKLLAFGLCYVIWRRVPRPYCTSVPLTLAGLGAAVTAWNVYVVLMAVHA